MDCSDSHSSRAARSCSNKRAGGSRLVRPLCSVSDMCVRHTERIIRVGELQHQK